MSGYNYWKRGQNYCMYKNVFTNRLQDYFSFALFRKHLTGLYIVPTLLFVSFSLQNKLKNEVF